jgi:hypothetical protein
MRTPAGNECKYFYGNYYRGRSDEECRLLQGSNPPQRWTPDLCRTCPVPEISRANACEFMHLNARVVRSLRSGLKRSLQVTAYCEKAEQAVAQPEIGCGQCHPLPPIFEVKK